MNTRKLEVVVDKESCIHYGRLALLRANSEGHNYQKKMALATEAIAWFNAADFAENSDGT